VPDPGFAGGRLTAIVFDIDGTMYRQGQLRRAMLARLVGAHAAHPIVGWHTLHALRAYRQAQERLRGAPASGDVGGAQIRLAAERANMDPQRLAQYVDRWMEREPLALLPRCVRPGLRELIVASRSQGIRLATLSDYPAQAKLAALGVSGMFDAVLCAQDPEIGAFKPNPRGLLVALERLDSRASETLYVGDREDVDAPAAHAAGMPCALITERQAARRPTGPLYVTSFAELHRLLFS
jgi:FMN phosphatase YigB (HAD superfamily)